MKTDTICAISTPLGTGGISIIRISGNESLNILKTIFHTNNKNNYMPRKMYLGELKFQEFSDEALCVYFKTPNSFTGEDVVEINLHGGYYLTNKVLEEILRMPNIRLAEPGEFSKRAVLNGKMDLTKAEAIIDMINANSMTELRANSQVLLGALAKKIKNIQNEFTDLISQVDVALDYPDEDIEYISNQTIKNKLIPILDNLNNLHKTSQTGIIIKNGVNVALYGIPNAGKSSLLNALLGYDRAIVTDIAGTTRDVLNESYEYNGVRFNIIDTAGIHNSDDTIEIQGINRAKEQAKNADIVLHIIDNTIIDKQQLFNKPDNPNIITVLNKIDKTTNIKHDLKCDIEISAKNNFNINELKQLIFDRIINKNLINEQILITNLRHKLCLEESISILTNLLDNLSKDTPLDCIALMLKEAWLKIGEITGDNTNDDIINNIFNKFCLGK